MVKEFFGRLFKGAEAPAQIKETQGQIKIHTVEIGSTGTSSNGGYPSEEYLDVLTGKERADVFDKMRRSDGQIKMCLNAVKGPILSALWSIEPGEQDDQEAEADAELVEHILFKSMDKSFNQFLKEALTMLDFGHSVFERIDKPVLDDQELGQYSGIKTLAWRSPRTIERWNLDRSTGKLASITQYAYGDLDRQVDIPAEFLLVFTLDMEGSNYEGISALRACYGNWFRKNTYYKLNAIGIEKFAIPTPIVTVPVGSEQGDQYSNMIAVLERYMAHEKGYITKPSGWEIDVKTNSYDPAKVEASIDAEDKRIAKSFMANFLELGMNGFGSQSLSFDLSDFFLNAIDHIACYIEEEINKNLIPHIVQMNKGPRMHYPKLKHSGITDKAGKELADIVKGFADSRLILPDAKLEEHLRERYDLPEQSEEGRREGGQQTQQSENENQMTQQVPKLKELMKRLRRG